MPDEKKIEWPHPRDEAWFWAFVEAVGGPSAKAKVPISPEGVVPFVRDLMRLSPPPSRAGEEVVEARAKALAEEIDRRYMDWHHEMPRAENLAPPLTRALESEWEACAKVCDRIEAKHRAHANALRDQGADAEACSYRDAADAVADCAAAIRDGAKGA